VAEIFGKARHLRAVGIADEERRRPGQNRHRHNDGMVANCAHGVGDVGQAAHGAPRRRHSGAKARPIRRVHQPEQERQIKDRIEKDAVGWSEPEQDEPTRRRPNQHAEIACGGIEPDRAHQIGRPDDVVEQHLHRRKPQHAGAAMHHQQQHRLPHLQGVGDEQIAPAERH
jgi:hypothetical protein